MTRRTKCSCGEREDGEHGWFDGWFDADDLAFPLNHDTPPEQVPPGIRWTTFCNRCGSEIK